MKKLITTAVIAFFTAGTFAFAQNENQEEIVDLTPQKGGEETTEAKAEEAKVIPAILTHKVESKKLAGKEEEITVAPLSSIFVDGDKYFVLAKGAESDINFVQLEVEVGKTDGVLVEITHGLAPGDEVIAVTMSQLKFPAFSKEELTGGACFTGACPTTGGETYTGKECKDGECDLTIKASEFFSDKFHEGYGPGFGPGPGPGSFGGPGYGPSY